MSTKRIREVSQGFLHNMLVIRTSDFKYFEVDFRSHDKVDINFDLEGESITEIK